MHQVCAGKARLAVLFETICVYGEILPPLKVAGLRGGPRSPVSGDGIGLRELVKAGDSSTKRPLLDWTRFPQKAGMPSGQAGRRLCPLPKMIKSIHRLTREEIVASLVVWL